MGIASAIGGALALGGSLLSSSSNNRNARRAAETSERNNTANVALQRDIYNQNRTALSPFMSRGNAAGDAINALLGIPGAPTQTQPTATPNALSQFGGFTPFNGDLPEWIQRLQGNVTTNTVAPAAPQNTLDAQTAAFDNFRNSTGYQFRLNEGMDALNSNYFGAGVGQSGAALQALQEYGQNFASNEFGNYMGMLANQQGVGLSGASALAGVGQNYANNVTAMNTNNANNQANAYLARQNGFGNALGMIGGSLMGGILG